MTNVEKRFPFADYPEGWFQVAYSREVDTGQVVGLHYFGRQLIRSWARQSYEEAFA